MPTTTKSRAVYATLPGGTRVGAQRDHGGRIHVWTTGADGRTLGIYNAERIAGALTPSSLVAMLAPSVATAEAVPHDAVLGSFCPNCNAQPGRPCTAPTSTGRRDVKTFHFARERAAEERIRTESQRPDPAEVGRQRRERGAAVREKIAQDAAAATLKEHCIQPHWVRTGDQIEALLTEAAARAIAAYRGEKE